MMKSDRSVDHALADGSTSPRRCRTGIRKKAGETFGHASPQAGVTAPRVSDRFGECAGACPLRAPLRPPRTVSDGDARFARLRHPGALRILGTRGVPDADVAVSADAVSHGQTPRANRSLHALEAGRLHGGRVRGGRRTR